MGVMTACVGGIIRDVLANEPSILMRPELYVTAAALAAGLFVGLTCSGVADLAGGGGRAAAGFALRGSGDRSRLVIARLSRLSSRNAGRPLLLILALPACATVPVQPPVRAEVGVAFDANGEIASFAEGLADPQSRRAVTPDDPARVASVSKLVVAVGVMQLVEAGKLDLDRDVSDYLGWSLRNPHFPDRPISLRMLLSHTSSVREHDDNYVLPLGASLAGGDAGPARMGRRARPRRQLFRLHQHELPDRRLGRSSG